LHAYAHFCRCHPSVLMTMLCSIFE
jgi:hypothetical protein